MEWTGWKHQERNHHACSLGTHLSSVTRTENKLISCVGHIYTTKNTFISEEKSDQKVIITTTVTENFCGFQRHHDYIIFNISITVNIWKSHYILQC